MPAMKLELGNKSKNNVHDCRRNTSEQKPSDEASVIHVDEQLSGRVQAESHG